MTARKSHQQLHRELCDARDRVFRPTGDYTHNGSGDRYRVSDVSFRESDMSIEVIYYPVVFPAIMFHRPLEEFLERFTNRSMHNHG